MSPWEQSCESRWCVGCARDMWGSGRSVSVCDKWILKMLQFLMSHKMWVISPRVMDKSRVLGAAKCLVLPGPGLWKLWPAPRRGFNFSSAELLQCRAVTSGNTLNTHLSDVNSCMIMYIIHTHCSCCQ